MSEPKRFSLVKPTTKTPFRIDFEWWKQNKRNWRTYLRGYLTLEDMEALDETDSSELVDLVDQETAEVHQVDGLQHLLITRYANQEDFITETTPMIEAVFRLFLTNGNTPMSSEKLSEQLGRPALTILRTLSGPRVHKGLRPCPEC